MIKKLLLVLVVIVLGVLVAASFQPDEFRITRSATISAPPSAVFPHINDFRNWDAWSPWAKLDPNMKKTLEGPPAGVGAVYGWAGNQKAGEGRMTILESRPDEWVQIKLEFIKPFAATNTAEFTLKPVPAGTEVTWSMYGRQNFISKIFSLAVNVDKMVGTDFEKGLTSIKTLAEAKPQP